MEGVYKATGLKKGLATMANKRVGKSAPQKEKYAVTGNKKLAMDSGYEAPKKNGSVKNGCSY